MTNNDYARLKRRARGLKPSKKKNESCVFANTVNGCDCGALSNYYCDDCKFYKSKNEYAIDEGGFVHRKEV